MKGNIQPMARVPELTFTEAQYPFRNPCGYGSMLYSIIDTPCHFIHILQKYDEPAIKHQKVGTIFCGYKKIVCGFGENPPCSPFSKVGNG
jgi:hypothetical protein